MDTSILGIPDDHLKEPEKLVKIIKLAVPCTSARLRLPVEVLPSKFFEKPTVESMAQVLDKDVNWPAIPT